MTGKNMCCDRGGNHTGHRYLGWEYLEFEPGEQGVAVCEALGINPSGVVAEPIHFMRMPDGHVYLNYTKIAYATTDQLDTALRIVG